MQVQRATPARATPPSRSIRVALDLWPALLACVLTLPLLTAGGYPLGRDLVFVPHQPLTDASLGLTDGAPRAVPLDALVAVLSVPLDGAVLARLLVPGALAVAGWGVHRLVGELGTAGRLAAAGFAVWNPFVVERLALGQWALLWGYAALPWIVLAARRRRPRSPGPALLWTALASVTPTGGLLAVATSALCGVRDRRSALTLLGGGLALQLPWLVPALLVSGGGRADPVGVDAFAPDTEGPWGVGIALLGLGGIWDARSEPVSRLTVLAVVSAVVVLAALAAGLPRLTRSWGAGDVVRLAEVALAGAVVAGLAATPAGQDLLRAAMVDVPGAGLLRDAQKFLAPAVVLVAVAFGAAVDAGVGAARRLGSEVALVCAAVGVLAPVALVADAADVTWPTVRPVTYPAGFDAVAAAMPDDGTALATAPWRSYRLFAWGHGLVSSDPAFRWYDREVVVSDDLAVGDRLVRGESARGRAVGDAVHGASPAADLADLGVGWLLVYLDDPDAASVDVTGLELVHEDADLRLYAVPGARPDAASAAGPTTGERGAVAAAYVVAGLVLAGAATAAARARRRRPWAETDDRVPSDP